MFSSSSDITYEYWGVSMVSSLKKELLMLGNDGLIKRKLSFQLSRQEKIVHKIN